MIGQMQILDAADPASARLALLENKARILELANQIDPVLIKFGGGARDLEVKVIGDSAIGPFLVVPEGCRAPAARGREVLRVRFGQALAGGLARLKELLGGGATIKKGSLNSSPYAPPWFNNTVYIPESTNAQWLRQTVVHELAHVIDWHNNFSVAWAKQNGALTDYAADFHPYPAVWDVWAEAVTVWVFGDKDPNSGVWTSSINLLPGMQNALTTQMDRLTVLLGGSR